MSETFDCTTEDGRAAGLEAALTAIREHELVVMPTDTVYGVGADAFSPDAVQAILDAKGRGREMPPPVLIPHARTVDGLATAVPGYARDLMDEFWPGGLTLVLLAQASLMWDLGDTNGTVALRVPEDPTALALLEQAGPMAVTSANLTGRPAALNAREALLMLGDAVAVYLDGGPSTGTEPSTIVDCTQSEPRILRHGVIPQAEIERVLGGIRLGATSVPDPAVQAVEILPDDSLDAADEHDGAADSGDDVAGTHADAFGGWPQAPAEGDDDVEPARTTYEYEEDLAPHGAGDVARTDADVADAEAVLTGDADPDAAEPDADIDPAQAASPDARPADVVAEDGGEADADGVGADDRVEGAGAHTGPVTEGPAGEYQPRHGRHKGAPQHRRDAGHEDDHDEIVEDPRRDAPGLTVDPNL